MRKSVALLCLSLSILLSSAAQLAFRFAMMGLQLSALNDPAGLLLTVAGMPAAKLILLAAGIAMYAISMISWILALVRFDVSAAYPANAVAYVIVYVAAVSVPALNESVSINGVAGMVLILSGVLLLPGRPFAKSER